MSTKRACDSCHRRKIRCDGVRPCDNCRHSDLECTYNAVPKKKGPSGRRAKIIYAIRASQTQAKSFTPQIPLSASLSPTGVCFGTVPPPSNAASRDLNLCVETPASYVPSPALRQCVDVFFRRMYPIMPILHDEAVYNALSEIHSNPEAYCLITALCGLVIMQPQMNSEPTDGICEQQFQWPPVEYLIQETIRGRQGWDYIENPTLWTVITSFFLFACYFGLDKHNAAWFYLRESITFAQLLGLANEDSYALVEEREATLRRRMFWLLFVTERAYALQRHRPLSLQKSIVLPSIPDGPESLVLQGFLDLVGLFHHFDDSFVSLWNNSATATDDVSWLPKLQQNLDDALPDVDQRTDIQQADLLVSRQWLKTMVWQLCVAKGLLSNTNKDESMTFHYPVQIARDMVILSKRLTPNAAEPHGVGLLEKIFDMGSSLADVIKVLPPAQSAFEIGPRDYLVEFLNILSTLRGGSSRYFPLLAAQADEVLKCGSGVPRAGGYFLPGRSIVTNQEGGIRHPRPRQGQQGAGQVLGELFSGEEEEEAGGSQYGGSSGYEASVYGGSVAGISGPGSMYGGSPSGSDSDMGYPYSADDVPPPPETVWTNARQHPPRSAVTGQMPITTTAAVNGYPPPAHDERGLGIHNPVLLGDGGLYNYAATLGYPTSPSAEVSPASTVSQHMDMGYVSSAADIPPISAPQIMGYAVSSGVEISPMVAAASHMAGYVSSGVEAPPIAAHHPLQHQHPQQHQQQRQRMTGYL